MKANFQACVEGKLHKNQFPSTGGKRAKQPLELVHGDVCGKIQASSLSGGHYFLTFIDDHTQYVWVYILKNKSEVFEKFVEWKALVENSTGQKLKTLHTDNGGEHRFAEITMYLKKEGVHHELTVPKTPQQNGVAERMNRTLVEVVCSMLSDAKLPRMFWAEAISTAVIFIFAVLQQQFKERHYSRPEQRRNLMLVISRFLVVCVMGTCS